MARYLETNPFSLIRRKGQNLVTNRPIEHYLTKKEWGYIMDYINNMPHKTLLQRRQAARTKWIFCLLYLTGCRRNEVAQAKMSDVFQHKNQWWLKVTGKGNKEGTIPVTTELLKCLIEYRRSLGLCDYPTYVETNIPLINSIKVEEGKFVPITATMLYSVIKNVCFLVADSISATDEEASNTISLVSTHWLRHTSATHQVDAGIDIRVVKANLRHSMLETTMKYQHTDQDARHLETNNKFGLRKD